MYVLGWFFRFNMYVFRYVFGFNRFFRYVFGFNRFFRFNMYVFGFNRFFRFNMYGLVSMYVFLVLDLI